MNRSDIDHAVEENNTKKLDEIIKLLEIELHMEISDDGIIAEKKQLLEYAKAARMQR